MLLLTCESKKRSYILKFWRYWNFRGDLRQVSSFDGIFDSHTFFLQSWCHYRIRWPLLHPLVMISKSVPYFFIFPRIYAFWPPFQSKIHHFLKNFALSSVVFDFNPYKYYIFLMDNVSSEVAVALKFLPIFGYSG